MSGAAAAGPIVLGVVGSAVLVFWLLYIVLETKQRKLLPKSWWRPISAMAFWPLVVPSMLKWRINKRPRFTEMGGGIICGGSPLVCFGHVKQLHVDGVRAVVNMQAEYGGPVNTYARLDPPIAQLHLPVIDHIEPTVDELEAAVEFIERHRAKGERVLVHCKGGHGRSAAVCAAWLMHSEHMTPEGAQRRLSSLRKVRKTLDKQPELLAFYRRRGGDKE